MMANQTPGVDNFDNLIDLSDYDNTFPSPGMSPATASKNMFPARPTVGTVHPSAASSSSQPPARSGPSHQYELYKQQTGIVPGALASTLAVNQAKSQMGYNGGFGMDYMNGVSPETEMFDFATAPSLDSRTSSNGLDMDMDYGSPADNQYYFQGTETINPNAINGQESPATPAQTNNVGRLWPGMHTQAAAMAKAQAHQRQQSLPAQQQQRPPQAKPRTKSAQPTDPIVEQKITQLLNSMRAKSGSEDGSPTPLMNISRPKKDEDDMDEDERLLASEEGKKLSSKERRQLRNKVSARAFRSRRKEYITQLESEIANKVTENSELRNQNRLIMEENKRLTDLTRMLLSSTSFSSFLDDLSNNPQAVPQQQAQQLAVKTEPQQNTPQPPKDTPAYVGPQQQQIGMAMIPEQPMDFSQMNLSGGNDPFGYQPQVFAVTETPEIPAAFSADVLSGKTSNFVGEALDSDDDKLELPALDAPKDLTPTPAKTATEAEEVFDDEFENDPEFALYHSSPSRGQESPSDVDIFGGLEPEKVLARYELVDASQVESDALVAMARVQRISAALDSLHERLESLCL